MFLPCYIFFTHFEFAAKFIYRLHFTGYFIRFFHVYETIKYWRGTSCRAKIQLLFYYCFYFQILKAGGLPCYNLDRRTAAISHVFLSATTKEKKMYRSKKFEDLTISDDFYVWDCYAQIPNIVNRFWKLYWILRFHALSIPRIRKRLICLWMRRASGWMCMLRTILIRFTTLKCRTDTIKIFRSAPAIIRGWLI